jgi:hypothetical protein
MLFCKFKIERSNWPILKILKTKITSCSIKKMVRINHTFTVSRSNESRAEYIHYAIL